MQPTMITSDTKKEALLIFLLLTLVYAYFYHDASWNGNSRLGLTFAIVQEGRLTIDSFHNQEATLTGDKSFYNGHYYSDKAIGSSLLAVLFYFPLHRLEQLANLHLAISEIKYLLTFFSIGLPSAIAGSLMYMLCKQVTGSRYRAYISTISVSLGTMIFPFSVIFFGHQLAGSLLFGAFFFTFQLRTRCVHNWKGMVFLIGFLLGSALITEYTITPILLILVSYFLFPLLNKEEAKRKLAIFLLALGASIPVVILIAYNTAVFGNPLSVGYSYEANQDFQKLHSQGLIGVGWPNLETIFFLTVHPAMGLFWQSPVLIVSLIGIWFAVRKENYRDEALLAATAFLSLLTLVSGISGNWGGGWWGGWSFGPRYLIPMISFLCLPLALIPKRWFSSVVILGSISTMQMFIVVSSRVLTPERYYKQLDQLSYFAYSSIYDYCLPLLVDGIFATNLGRKFFGLNTWLSLVPTFLLLIIFTWFFIGKHERPIDLPSQPN